MIKNIMIKEKNLSLKQITHIKTMIPKACNLYHSVFQSHNKSANNGQGGNKRNRGTLIW
jgi:hypothetical protein